ncbi:MAG: ATP-dependent zinc protease [Armatimonadetes bacterium]|nr:ATP-dependent zinc protease [Armatimonadota bacterium]MBS1710209.1 ATP-dependent zinc protease [Armatimonadota bacterium]MBX3110099.1 RimK/LysX family protein [Fimbriimonadaceae bacterium]
MPRKSSALITIGWLERVSFPDWGIDTIIAKIDTGARTSSIHAENVSEREDGLLEFDVVEHIDHVDKWVHVVCPYVRKTSVRSSSGRAQNRYVVKTRMVLGGVEKVIEITLSSRKKMLRRVLIGRTTLAKSFVVDVSRKHLA